MTQSLIHKRKSISYVSGDIFDNINYYISAENNGSSIVIPHVCNNINLFGAGFAGAVAKHYPVVKENYHLLGSAFLKNNLGHTQFIEVCRDKTYGHKLIFANMIAQNSIISKNNNRPLNYLALAKSMVNVNKYIKSNFDNDSKVQIHAPKFGCGLAGGNWNFIENLIEDIWTDIDVTIYTYGTTK
jgi:hypothetical protein